MGNDLSAGKILDDFPDITKGGEIDLGAGELGAGLGAGAVEAGALGGIVYAGSGILNDLDTLAKGKSSEESTWKPPSDWNTGKLPTGPIGPIGPIIPFDPRQPLGPGKPTGPLQPDPKLPPTTTTPTDGPTSTTKEGGRQRPTGQGGSGTTSVQSGEGQSGEGQGPATRQGDPENFPSGSKTKEGQGDGEADKKKKDDEEDPKYPPKKEDKNEAENYGSSTSAITVEPVNLSILQILKKTDKNQILLSDVHDKEYEEQSNKADVIVASEARADTRNTRREARIDDYVKFHATRVTDQLKEHKYIVKKGLQLDKINLDLMNFNIAIR
jgi:hypothetical protein